MGKRDLEELFALVDVGDTVQIRAERDEEIVAVFGSGSGDRDNDGSERIARVVMDRAPVADEAEFLQESERRGPTRHESEVV